MKRIIALLFASAIFQWGAAQVKEGKITYEDMIQRSYDPEQIALQAGGVVPPKTTVAAGVGLSGTADAKPKGRWI